MKSLFCGALIVNSDDERRYIGRMGDVAGSLIAGGGRCLYTAPWFNLIKQNVRKEKR